MPAARPAWRRAPSERGRVKQRACVPKAPCGRESAARCVGRGAPHLRSSCPWCTTTKRQAPHLRSSCPWYTTTKRCAFILDTAPALLLAVVHHHKAVCIHVGHRTCAPPAHGAPPQSVRHRTCAPPGRGTPPQSGVHSCWAPHLRSSCPWCTTTKRQAPHLRSSWPWYTTTKRCAFILDTAPALLLSVVHHHKAVRGGLWPDVAARVVPAQQVLDEGGLAWGGQVKVGVNQWKAGTRWSCLGWSCLGKEKLGGEEGRCGGGWRWWWSGSKAALEEQKLRWG